MFKSNNFSTGNKILETFIVTFFGTIGSYVGALVKEDDFLTVAFSSGIAAIVGLVLYEYLFQGNDSSEKSKSRNSESNSSLTPIIATIFVLVGCIFFRNNLYILLSKIFGFPPQDFQFGVWLMALVIFDTFSSVLLASIHHIKEYGFGETLSDKIEFIFSRLFFILGYGLLIIIGSSIAILIVSLFFLLLFYLGLNYFKSGENILDSMPITSVSIVVELYLIYIMNQMSFEDG